MRRLPSVLVVLVVSLLNTPASFAALFSSDEIGNTVEVNYNGMVKGEVINGLSAYTRYTLEGVSADGSSWMFSGTLTNTSSVTSRVSIVGFNTSPEVDPASSVAGGFFSKVSSGKMSQGVTVDLCLKNTKGKNCAGGGGLGVWGGETVEFLFTLSLCKGSDSLELDGYALRYQSIAGIAQGSSGVGIGSEVPLPAAAWMFLSALLGLGLTRR